MRHKIGTVCMVLGTALVIAALSLFFWNDRENRRAGEAAGNLLPQLKEQIGDGDADPYESAMTEVMIDGYSYIGYVAIPELGLELPVMSEWSYPRLRIAPCRYFGSTKTDDLVIAAHNYSRHFGNIKNLTPGDAVYFTDMDGVVTVYGIVEVDTLNPTDVEEMTDSGYDLTLFTCTYGGKSRVTVRCDRTE